ncbi:MAG: hypothetical protein H0X66_13100 [Verrucomicrobia bacterium]|nr:hypothetical protein [Verrucomicrobiota bacterium]
MNKKSLSRTSIITPLFCALAVAALADDFPRISATATPSAIVLRWPSTATNFILETAAPLDAGTWSIVPYPVGIRDGQKSVRLPASEQQRFFRLRQTAPHTNCFECTQVIGYSQVGAQSGWYVTDGVFESVVPDAKWQLLWNSGAGVDRWQDPNYSGWTNKFVSPCPVISNAPTRVVLSISGPYGSNEAAWADAIDATIKTIRQKLPTARRIILQPVVGGPAHASCSSGDQLVRASWQHKHIDNAIADVVTRRAGGDIEVHPGFSPEVRTCSDYADSLGHLTRSAGAAAGRAVAEYFLQLDYPCEN